MKVSKMNAEVLNWVRRKQAGEIHYVKLPKQWKHWLRRLHLRPTHSGQRDVLYIKGRGFVWRVAFDWDNPRFYFQRGDRHTDFDRWALCDLVNHHRVPQTFAELKAFVEQAEKS